MEKQGLKNRALKGSFWSAADAFLGYGVTFLVGIILARILSPEEYGLIGIVLIFTSVLSGIVDSGFSNALIRKKTVSNKDYNTMFIINMVMSFLLYILLWIFSPLIANFFLRPELTSITRVMGLLLVFQALSIAQVTILTKRIDFKTKTKASLIAALTSGTIGVVMAYLGYGVWSLVAQQLSNKLVYSLCLFAFNKWWPEMVFSYESFRYMWGFGWKIMLSGILNNIWNQLYQVVVGKCYSPATLGQYSRSKEYAQLFSANFTGILQRVTYPALSELQDDKVRMVSAYRRIIKISMFITAISMTFLGAVSEPLLYCLIGPKWHEASTYLPLICISMSLYPIHAINLNMLQVQGRSDIFLYLEIIKKIISIVPLCLGIFAGIYWMLIGSIFTGVIAFFLNSYYTGKKLEYSSWMQIKDITPSYAVALVIAIAVFFIKFLPLNYYLILAFQVIVGFMVFFIVCESLKMKEYLEIKEIATARINTLRK